MPTKFKPDSFEYIGTHGDRKQVVVKNYITATPKKELFATINNSSAKPKLKQKCKNELIRRGIKLSYISTKNPELDLGVLK